MVAFGFLPPNFFLAGVGGAVGEAYELSFCSKRNAASVVLTMWGDGDTETLLGDKKSLNFMHSQVLGIQKLSNFP